MKVRTVPEGADPDTLERWLAANGMRDARWYTDIKIDGGWITARRVLPLVPGDPSVPLREPGPHGAIKTMPVWHELVEPLPLDLVRPGGWSSVVNDGPKGVTA